MTDYSQLTERIKARLNPENDHLLEKSFLNESLTIQYGEVEKYIRFAMKGVESEYTQKSRDAGNRVKTHLEDVLSQVSYHYQGSVMTNTHIKATSDIDLLVISEKFYQPDRNEIDATLKNYFQKSNYNKSQQLMLESELKVPFYSGNALEDLKENRKKSETKLQSTYDTCNISKPKAIKITNLSLKRDVDVVIASWFDNVRSIINGKNVDFRGIQIYNKDSHKREKPDFPFLKIKLVNERSSETNGRLKKMIRFLKNIKAAINHNNEKSVVTLSSFQFNAICYDIDPQNYKDKNIYELVVVLYAQLKSLSENSEHRNNLKSVDGSEYVFKDEPNKALEIGLLIPIIESIILDLKAQNAI